MRRRGRRNNRWCGRILLFVAIVGLLGFLLPLFFSTSLNIGNVTGMVVCVILGAYAIFMSKVHETLKQWSSQKGMRWLVRGTAFLLGIVFLLVIVESCCMISAASRKPTKNATLVVLGCRVYGERASLSLTERLEAAYDYLQNNPDAVCILSGGMGGGENISEAECMYCYLTDQGIESQRLYKEEQSTSTRENLKFSMELVEELGLPQDIAIATSEYHQYRAGVIAKELGMEVAAVNGRTAWWLFPTYYIRELYGILYQWFF